MYASSGRAVNELAAALRAGLMFEVGTIGGLAAGCVTRQEHRSSVAPAASSQAGGRVRIELCQRLRSWLWLVQQREFRLTNVLFFRLDRRRTFFRF